MRKLIVSIFISLDGVIQSPGAPQEDTTDNFKLGGWIVPYSDETIGRTINSLISQRGDLLLGRRTFDIFSSYWPQVPADSPSRQIADIFNNATKHVVTHHADTLDWQPCRALSGNLADSVRALKQETGPDLVTFGSGEVVRQLLAAGLVDDLRLLTYPVMLGRGKRLFGSDALTSSFTLEHACTTPDGVLITRYLRGGEVRTGAFD
jgi:dihydrofolate reductase